MVDIAMVDFMWKEFLLEVFGLGDGVVEGTEEGEDTGLDGEEEAAAIEGNRGLCGRNFLFEAIGRASSLRVSKICLFWVFLLVFCFSFSSSSFF